MIKCILAIYRRRDHRTSVGFITLLANEDVLAMFERGNITGNGFAGELGVNK